MLPCLRCAGSAVQALFTPAAAQQLLFDHTLAFGLAYLTIYS